MELKDRIIDKINETICEKNETPFPKKITKKQKNTPYHK